MTEDPEGGKEIKTSKSQRKREMHALQDMATRLSKLSDRDLERLGISGATISVLALARSMRASGARHRQIRYAAKLLSQEDIRRSQALFADREAEKARVNQQFHVLERWCDRLVAHGDSVVSELLEAHPDLNRQQIRQLVRAAQRERQLGKPPANARKLFKLLRTELSRKSIPKSTV